MKKREVKKQVGGLKKEVKKDFELDILNLLKKGLNPTKIAVHLNISKQNLQYYLSSLKKQNVIKKIGYGVWEIIPTGEVKILSHKGSLQVKDVRGHAFIWKIKPNKKLDWIKILKSKKIDYELKGLSKTPRIIIGGKKIWLGNNFITIFEPKWNSFFATNPIESKKEAIFSMIDTIEEIKRFSKDFKYKFTCRRQHYGFVNNKEALYFNRKGKKILIKNEKGYWFSIDYSQNKYKEAETIHEKDADVDGLGYQKLMNSHEKTNFKVTPDFILNGLNMQNKMIQQVTSNQLMFNENFESHVSSIKQLGFSAEANSKSTELLANTILQMKESFEGQVEKLRTEIGKIEKHHH